MLVKDVDINAKNDLGQTSLHIAAEYGQIEVVKALMAEGADLNPEDGEGKIALSLANEKKHKEIVELLRKHKARE